MMNSRKSIPPAFKCVEYCVVGKRMLMSDLTVIQCDIKKKQESRDRMLKAAGSMCVLAACIIVAGAKELLRTGSLLCCIWRH